MLRPLQLRRYSPRQRFRHVDYSSIIADSPVVLSLRMFLRVERSQLVTPTRMAIHAPQTGTCFFRQSYMESLSTSRRSDADVSIRRPTADTFRRPGRSRIWIIQQCRWNDHQHKSSARSGESLEQGRKPRARTQWNLDPRTAEGNRCL